MKNRPLLIVFITVFIDLVGFGMIIPLSPYLAQQFGANSFQVGLLMAVYSGAQFLFSPLWGQLSDRVGRRPIILLSVFGAGVAHLGFGLGSQLWILFAARTFAGVFGANISTAMAAIADITDEKSRSKGMGVVGAAFGLGFVLGPALGGFLAQYGFSTPAIGAATICFCNFILAYFVFPETLKQKKTKDQQEKLSRFDRLRKHIRRAEVAPLLVFSFLISFSMANMEASLFLFVEDQFNWDLKTASFGFAYVGIMMAFTQGYLIRKFLPKFGEVKLLTVGSILFGLGMLIVGLSSQVWMVAVGMTSLALGSGMFNPSAQGLVSLKSNSTEQGEVMGVMQSLSALARIFGPPCGGYLYGAIGHSSPFLLAAGLSSGVVFWIVRLGHALAVNRPNGSSKAVALNSDILAIGRFQVENILRHNPNVGFFELETGIDRKLLVEHRNWKATEWVFNRAQKSNVKALKDLFASESKDRSRPMIFICQDGRQSEQLVKELDAQGFINVFWVEGGSIGLLNEGDDN